MTDVLSRIVERKRSEVAERLQGRTFAARPTSRSLNQALVQPGARFIFEVKLASPSGHRAKASIEEAAKAYVGRADAISVLTDGPDFGGSLEHIARIRRSFDGPILAKDFVVSPLQVAEARAAGADAVLAMMSVLDDEGAIAVRAEADRLKMDVIYEVHNEGELRRALALGSRIIGINNRDLKTLSIDLGVTERLAPLIPQEITLISESGIAARSDVQRLSATVDAFLVGSSLMASDDIQEAVRSLIFGKVKICGVTNQEDLELVAQIGATHVGFIMVPGSPRKVGPDEAALLSFLARRKGLKTVGVFRNADLYFVRQFARETGLSAVQLHGLEDADYISRLREGLRETTEIWDVRGVDENGPSRRRIGADRVLFDTGKRCGGTGRSFDWDLVRRSPDLCQAFIAGGLCPENIKAASNLRAFGLDIGSKIESEPGRKDPAKLAGIFDALRPASKVRG